MNLTHPLYWILPIAISISSVSAQENEQDKSLSDHHHIDFSHLAEFVADQTNPDYFTADDHDQWRYFLRKEHTTLLTIEQYFDEAAAEYQVPVSLLKVIGRVESNWTQIGPSIDRGWGIMHLVQNEMVNTLAEASLHSGIPEAKLKENAKANIRGAAALLAYYAGPAVVGKDDVTLWFDAAVRFTGLALPELRQKQAQLYFQKLKAGDFSQSIWNETILIKAEPNLQMPALSISNSKKSNSVDYAPAISNITPCNFGTGRNHAIDTWVNHWIGVGTYAGAISWFHTCRPDSPSSAHFVIRSNDGEITQVVGVTNTAYHAGASGFPFNNSRSIGVEHEATAVEPSLWNSTPMINASAEMACFFAEQYSIPITRGLPGIREHKEMPGTNTACAGSIPWTVWMNAFTTCVNGGNLDCSQAVNIQCGVPYLGSASSASSMVDAYSCNNWSETGPERIHRVVSEGYGTLTATISNFAGDLDVYILGSCNPNDCLGTVNSSSAFIEDAVAGQVYYIVVDADDGSGSTYDLLVECPSGGSAQGLDCAGFIPLQCGVVFTGTLSSDPSAVNTYGCNNWTETGPERVHTITPNANGILTASLSNYTGDLDVYILGSCNPDDCVGIVNSDSAILNGAVAGQTYYIVVDADDGSGSEYDLLVECPQIGLSCFNAIALECGLAYAAPASTNSSYVDSYSCNTWTETGPERVHVITPTENGTLTASLSNYTGDLDVYILASCDPNDCVGTVSSESASLLNAIAGQSYFIVVDADDGSNSGYTLIVDCPESNSLCANAIEIECNQLYVGSASIAISEVDAYNCNNWTETGPERVHRIVPDESGPLVASISNYTGDLDVYILNSCDPNDCVGTVSSENAEYQNAQMGQAYYIIVDSDDGSGSGYDLLVECHSSGNGSLANCNTNVHVTGVYEYDKAFQAEQLLSADAQFSSQAEIVMRAGVSVELMNGFIIEEGSVVEVQIANCEFN